ITGAALSHLFLDSYLSIVDQAGASGSVGLWGNNYLEGNLGYLHGIANGNRFGGTLRFVFPLNSKISFTAEGGMNETLLGPSNSGRAVFGLEFGNMLRPKQFLGASNPVPVDPPRVRYEVLTRRMRVGNDPPVADAGPNQFNVPAGTITLDGSKSYDPDGDPITFQWVQESGPAVSLSSPTGQTTAFTAAAGVFYSFRLLVKDNLGGQSIARVSVSTQKATPINIVFFAANPNQISSGQSSTLTWNVTGATSVTISGIGTVAANGSAPVSPTQTTTYTLTASNGGTSQTATAVIAVNQVASKLQYCYATPTNIMAGESATLNWATTNATSVNIQPGIGAVANSGNVAVSPTQTTTYVVTATGANGSAPDSCDITVSVTAGQLPRVLQFSAAPATIDNGQSSTLQWSVENADTVTITTLGNFSLNGTQSVSPTATTTYTLTATNKAGTVTSTATVTVHNTAPPPGTGGTGPMIQIAGGPTISSIYHIVELDASATTSPSGNLPLTYEWTQASGAPSAIEHSTSAIAIIDLPLQLGEYTFNLRVTDSKGNSSTQLVTVELVGATAP
ncbi:MAG TPA: hypothetical protein VFW87_18980, partial [Pirellulales bacterium]|nr:hypothetical protein [Pirellulales bacterium]